MAGDIREIDMTKVTNLNGKKIRLVGDDGKGYWIEKEDFASVVGGLIEGTHNAYTLQPYSEQLIATGTGIYYLSEPANSSLSLLVVINYSYYYTLGENYDMTFRVESGSKLYATNNHDTPLNIKVRRLASR